MERTTHPEFWRVLGIFFRLGLTSFGGPVAHLGYFRAEFVDRRRWLTDDEYGRLLALCHFLPGPTSSQVGFAVGLRRCGYRGGLAAWLGFTLPSAIVLIFFALGLRVLAEGLPAYVLQGFKVAAVAVVAQAVWSMYRSLCGGAVRTSIMVLAAVLTVMLTFVLPSGWALAVPVAVLALAAVAGSFMFTTSPSAVVDSVNSPSVRGRVRRRGSIIASVLLIVLLIALPLAAILWPNTLLRTVDGVFRAGALVFGGGHVVLPLLQTELVDTGLVTADAFVAGYGLTQAVPGPLFTFAAYLGALVPNFGGPWVGGLTALVAIFLPGLLLLVAVLPHWDRLQQSTRVRGSLVAVNAAVVGLLLAALVDPVGIQGIGSFVDAGLVIVALVALMRWRVPPWAVVFGCAVALPLLYAVIL